MFLWGKNKEYIGAFVALHFSDNTSIFPGNVLQIEFIFMFLFGSQTNVCVRPCVDGGGELSAAPLTDSPASNPAARSLPTCWHGSPAPGGAGDLAGTARAEEPDKCWHLLLDQRGGGGCLPLWQICSRRRRWLF